MNLNALGCREDPGRPILKSSARLLAKLNYICPDVFPINGFLSGKNEHITSQQVNIFFHQDLTSSHITFSPLTNPILLFVVLKFCIYILLRNFRINICTNVFQDFSDFMPEIVAENLLKVP